MDQAIAQAVPDSASRRVGPDQVRQCAKIDVVLQDHVDELRVEPKLTEPEPVDRRPADQMADARADAFQESRRRRPRDQPRG